MSWGSRISRLSLVALALMVTMFSLTTAAQKPPAAALVKMPPQVSVAALQTMFPSMDGWTRAPLSGSVVTISDESGYTFADADYTNGAMKVRLTIGDTVGVSDCVMALAPLVAVLPAGYSQDVPPATSLKRFEFGTYQAASKWNGQKLEGEFQVVVGRFIVKAEGDHLDSIDPLRALVEKVDLKKLSELKPGK